MRLTTFIALAAGVLAGASLATHRRSERERRRTAAQPEPLQTWEGEGGAVPLRSGRTAQQVSPANARPLGEDGPLQAEASDRLQADGLPLVAMPSDAEPPPGELGWPQQPEQPSRH